MPPRRTLDPKLDIVFWLLFSKEQNRPLLIALLSAILGETPITSVSLLSKEPDPPSLHGKQIVLDLRVELGTGTHIDVEMQTQPRPALRERALYYWTRMYDDQLAHGEHYDKLRRAVVIFITDFVELPGEHFHSSFRLFDARHGTLLTDHIQIDFVELPKLRGVLSRNEEPNLAAWCKFFSATTDEELDALAQENPILKQAKEALDQLSADPLARYQAAHRETVLRANRMEQQAAMAQARAALAQAREVAHQEGRQEGKSELLLRLIAIKFGPPSASALAKISAASDDDLDRWAVRLLSAETLDALLDG